VDEILSCPVVLPRIESEPGHRYLPPSAGGVGWPQSLGALPRLSELSTSSQSATLFCRDARCHLVVRRLEMTVYSLVWRAAPLEHIGEMPSGRS
jgi:hypothetical protein